MKKNKKIVCTMLLWVVLIAGCTKSAPKDYARSIKDKTWWGQLTYTGKTAEYFSVLLNADNSLVWTQLSGDYDGQWILDGKHLTFSFTRNSVKIQADISDEDKLENITDNTDSYEINSGQLIVNPKLSLENTVWKGNWDVSPYQMSFLDGSKIKAKVGNNEYSFNYTRSPSGAVIRYTALSWNIMGVITSDNAIKGRDDGEHLLELVKQ